MIARLLAPPLCWSCGAPAPAGVALCRPCRGALRFLPREPIAVAGVATWAPVAYEGPARELVKALKFHAARAVAGEMAALIAANAPEPLLGGALAGAPLAGGPPPRGPLPGGLLPRAALVPVPLHPGRRRSRAFNQAEAIAAELAERTGLPLADCLERAGSSARQVGRGRAARLAGPPGAIRVGPAGAPTEALLVDDVVTTGGTLAACARALRASGAADVCAVAFARATGR